MFISGPAEVLEGNSAQYTAVVFPTTMKGSLRWSLEGSRTGASLDSNGLLTTTENGNSDSSLKIRVQFIPEEGDFILVTKDIVVKRRIYPSTSQLSISGATMLSAPETYTLQCSATNITGDYIVEWALGGDIASVAVIENATNSSCVVLPETVMGAVAGTISATARKRYNNSTIGTFSLNISAVNDTIAEMDAGVCAALYAAGLCANDSYITKDEARKIINAQLNPSGTEAASIFYSYRSQIKTFRGFRFFTSLTEIPNFTFKSCSKLTEIDLPHSLTHIGEGAFNSCSVLRKLVIPDSVKTTGNSICYNAGALQEVILSKNLTVITNFMFTYAPLIKIELHEGITLIGNEALSGIKLTELTIPNSVVELGNQAIGGASTLERLVLGSGIEKIGGAFTLRAVKELYVRAKSAPSVQSNTFMLSDTNYIGYNNAKAGLNRLYVPVDATGYDIGYWLDPLQNPEKCGFTISYTL